MNFLQLAFDESLLAVGISRPNPAVGAVVVKDGIVVGKGRTQCPGNAHAEVMANAALPATPIAALSEKRMTSPVLRSFISAKTCLQQ